MASYAQTNSEIGKVTWGIKAGINSFDLYGKEIDYIFADDKTTAEQGFNIGAFANTRLGKYFGLNHEIEFNQRNTGVQLTDAVNGDYASKLKRQYIDLVPVNLTFHFYGLQIYAGPYLSALLNANVNRKDDDGNYFKDKSIFGDSANDESESLYLQKFDFGINTGIEYQFGMGLSIGARYIHGFTDLFQYANSYGNEDTKNNNIKIYNKGLMVSLGYAFNKKMK